jgi:hypothetical protein
MHKNQIKEDIMDDNLSKQSYQCAGRVNIPVSVDSAIWAEFRKTVEKQYRPRKKYPKRPSYAKLLEDAVDSALMAYVNEWKGLGQDEDQTSEK